MGIYESTLIWYTGGENKVAEAFKDDDKIKGIVEYAHCKTRDELFNMLERSIRVTLIVSDRTGYDMVRALMTVNFNKTIVNVILKKDKTEGDLESLVEAYNKKMVKVDKTPMKQFHIFNGDENL